MRNKVNKGIEGRRKRLKRILERVKEALSISNKDYVLLQFPSKYKERSIDVIAIDSRRSNNLIIRIKLKSNVSREEANDLKKASLALDAVPIIVTDDDMIYDNIIYEKDGIFMLNERTLENVCSNRDELIAIYRKGELYLLLNERYLSELREKNRLTLSEMSYLTGISRRTILNYEKEGGFVTVEVADRLVSALGEEVIRSIDLRAMSEEFRKKVREDILSISTDKSGDGRIISAIKEYLSFDESMKLFKIEKSAPDILLKTSRRIAALVDATHSIRKYTIRDIVKKVTETVKLAELVKGKAGLVISKDMPHTDTILDELSTTNYLNKLEVIKR